MRLESSMFNLIPSPADERDYVLAEALSASSYYDFIVGVYAGYHPIYDQGQTSMCTGFAITGAEEYFRGERFSPGSIYGNREDGDYMGEGEYVREAMKDWYRTGLLPFDDMPLLGTTKECVDAYRALSEEVRESAYDNRLDAYYKLNHKSGKQVLKVMEVFQLPIIAGIPIYQSMSEGLVNGGVFRLPDEGEALLGGHAVRIIGIKMINGEPYYIIANSWGDLIDDAGYQYMPIDFPIWEMWLPIPHFDTEIVMNQDSSEYVVNGEFFSMDAVPVTVQGRVCVPLRFLSDAFGYTIVDWDADNRTAIVQFGADTLYFREGDDFFTSGYYDGMRVYYDDLVINFIDDNNRMQVPVRPVSEYLNYDVDYDAITRDITINNY